MQTVKEKISNMASSAKEHMKICTAKAEEKMEKSTARTEEEKRIAHERRKAKEAQAEMELHQDKVRHAQEKLRPKQPEFLHGYGYDHEPPVAASHPHGHLHGYGYDPPVAAPHGHHTVGTAAAPTAGHTAPMYPYTGHPPAHGHKKY
ncbi:Late Embryogenesis Abundant protein [Corchorus capsularis]|uniref:Late Embryogenesis Abundant protein n=1 Tax=Corchorus capsularis TaxID=210143 RepID=A0A1R3I3U8_COCAP|nr:Late Embryogenesis Abundant protein [Corchorus capsularis]